MGPARINWMAFAPDFQALPMNVEYVEREHEFDVDEHGKYLADMDTGNQSGLTSRDIVVVRHS
jgi:hypothetical protein